MWYQMVLHVGQIGDRARHDAGGCEEGTCLTHKR